MTPKMWTKQVAIDEETIKWINNIDPNNLMNWDKHFYLDGSGGDNSSDPRVRSLGWAWVQVLEIPSQEVDP